MIKLTKLEFGDSYCTIPTLVSFDDCWDLESFLRSIKHLLPETTSIDKYDMEMETRGIDEQTLNDILSPTNLLCIATQLKNEKEIRILQTLVDLAEKNEVFYTAVLLCNAESRNAEQESVLEYLKTHTNSVIDLERYNLLHDCKASDAASLVVQSIFAACVFPYFVIGLDSADVKNSILGLGLAAIVRTAVHKGAKKIFQAIAEQMSMQHNNWLQTHSVYFVAFTNDETLDIPLLAELSDVISDAIPESMNNFTGVIDDTMNDGEVLVVAIASGFTKYNKLFLQSGRQISEVL